MAMGEPGELQPCVVCILHLKSNGWRSTRSRGGGAHRGGEKVGMGPSLSRWAPSSWASAGLHWSASLAVWWSRGTEGPKWDVVEVILSYSGT